MLETNNVYELEASELLGRMDSDSVDLIVTSPPYEDARTYDGYSFDFRPIADASYRVLKPGGVCVWVVADRVIEGSESLTSFKQVLYFVEGSGFRLHDTMIWRKVFPGLMGKRYSHAFEYMFVLSKGQPNTFNPLFKANLAAGSKRSRGQFTKQGWQDQGGSREIHSHGLLENVWDIPAGVPDKISTGHPAPFPEELAMRHIATWTNPGDLVLDYFGGSGTTASQAKRLRRNWITGDISGAYCIEMRRRLGLPFTPRTISKARP